MYDTTYKNGTYHIGPHYMKIDLGFNPLYTNGFFSLVCNKLGTVHCTYLGVSGYASKKKCILLYEDLFYLYKQCRP